MICKRCGKDIVGTDKCLYCGKVLVETPIIDAFTSAETTNVENENTQLCEKKVDLGSTVNETQPYTSSQSIIDGWLANGSATVKAENAITILKSVIAIAFMIFLFYSLFAALLEWPALINFKEIFENNTTEEAIEFVGEFINTYCLGFALTFIGLTTICTVLKIVNNFSLAKWLNANKIDCRSIIVGGAIDKEQQEKDEYVAGAYLFACKPEMKRLCYIDLVVLTILYVSIVVFGLTGVIEMMHSTFYVVEVLKVDSPTTIMKEMFLNWKMIAMFTCLIIYRIWLWWINKTLKEKRSENLQSVDDVYLPDNEINSEN